MLPILMLLAFTAAGSPAASAAAPARQARTAAAADVPADSPAPTFLPGRGEDARVARIAFRLATAGLPRCPRPVPDAGIVLQHLSQFHPADRPTLIATQALDRGPGVIAVVPGGPAAAAGIRAGDVLLSIDGVALPPESGLSDAFEAARAHARADAISDLLARDAPVAVTVLRAGAVVAVRLAAVPVCPSRVFLARSNQRNAYADGQHVFLTTGLLARLRSDDELAFIVAHEMAHNILGHAVMLRGGTVRHGLGRTLGQSGRIVRGSERDADALGGELMIDAGFDAVAGAGILKRLDGTDLGIALFADHDPAGTRIAAIQAIATARGAR